MCHLWHSLLQRQRLQRILSSTRASLFTDVVPPFSASMDFFDNSKLSLTSKIFRTRVSSLSAQFRHRMLVRSEPSPLDISFPAINSRFKQALVFFWPPDIVSFLLKSFFVITLVQSKQICSLDAGETHTRSIVLVGVDPIPSAIQFKDSQISSETPDRSHATPHFLARNANENPLSETSRPLATSSLAQPLRGLKPSLLSAFLPWDSRGRLVASLYAKQLVKTASYTVFN